MSSHTETIYVPLLNEGADALRPVLAFRRADDLFEIASKNDDPEDEVWGFSSESLVRCEARQLAGGARLVAVELHSPRTPRMVQS